MKAILWMGRWIAGASVLVLAACGGGGSGAGNESASPTQSVASNSRQSAQAVSDTSASGDAAAAAASVKWSPIAYENQAFTVTGTQTVRFGVGTTWIVKTVTGDAQCSNAYFGSDPAYGATKHCELAITTPADASSAGWLWVANEGQSFTVSGAQSVRFGADAGWVVKTIDGSGQCSNDFFGRDPLFMTSKRCYVRDPDAGADQAPTATIVTPAQGATFKAGDTLSYSGRGSDREDGPLLASQLVFSAELHHDTHSHPFLAETVGSSGKVTIPVRGEVSANIFYRFILEATDSAGNTSTTTRDVLPQKSTMQFATSPAGLALSLDGQPITAPLNVLGVVGIERDIGAADQIANGRRYRFERWNDGGAAQHTISTPVANTTYTATFSDIGSAVNEAPSVALSAAAKATTGTPTTLVATASDDDGSVVKVAFYDGQSKLGETSSSPFTLAWTPLTTGVHQLTAQATDNEGATATSAVVAVTVSAPTAADTTAPQVRLTAPASLATDLLGSIDLVASASDNVGVSKVEFQVDGAPVGGTLTAAPYRVSVDSNAYASGQHVLRVRASDAAGNVSAWSSVTVEFGGNRPQEAGFTRNPNWVTGLDEATSVAQAPDGRLLVTEQGGAVRVVKGGSLLATPMLTVATTAVGERGLLGIAVHPSFKSNGFVYVYYTSDEGGAHNRISRFVAKGDGTTGTETVLVDLPALSIATNHNGGALHFGVDGKLYVGVGDNAKGANSQNLGSPLGKLLRFNDDGSIPSDNPFYDTQEGLARATWAYGLRNPFTFAVQPGSGKIFINDVGETTWEEINVGAPGANYGWPKSEGDDNLATGITGPLFTYKHSKGDPEGSEPGGFFMGYCIAGGSFYPSNGNFPAAYRNSYYFADYVRNFIGRIDLANGNAAYAFAAVSLPPVDVMAGLDGALYVLQRAGITRISAP